MRLAPGSLLVRVRDFLVLPLQVQLERIERDQRAALMAGIAAGERYADPRCLVRAGYRIASQFDEDGILDEIFRRIGATNRRFVEFGVGDGRENNTLSLLVAGWTGLWIEADAASAARIRTDLAEPLAAGSLRLREAFVTAENIEELLAGAGVPEEPDLLSIDIDGNDYWVWKALGRYRPRGVVVEYNASLGRTARAVQAYHPAARWDGTSAYGASLGALEDLGREKGYALVGCTLSGVNAFFVREDCLADRFLPPHTAERHYEPPRHGPDGAGHPFRWPRLVRP
jgi:hypothetical protein